MAGGSSTVGTLRVLLTANAVEFQRAMADAASSARDWQRNLSNIGRQATQLGGALTSSLTLPITALAGTLTTLAVTSASAGDAIAKNAREAGLAAGPYQEFQFALQQIADVTEDEMVRGFGRITSVIGEAAEGSKPAIETLQKLGFTAAQIASGVITTEDAFNRFVLAMQTATSPAQAMALAGDLIGDRLGPKLAGALRESGGQVEQLRTQFSELGLGMSAEALAASEQFNDQLDVMKRTFADLGREIGVAVMPLLTESLIPFMRDTGVPVLKQLADMVAGVVRWFSDLPGPVQGVIAGAVGLVAALGPLLVAIGAVATAISAALPVLSAIGGALAAVATGPIGLVVAAVVGLAAAWIAWGDDVTAVVSSTIGAIVEWFTDKLQPIWQPVSRLIGAIVELFTTLGLLVGAVLGEILEAHVRMVTGVILWLRDRLQPILRPLGEAFQAFARIFTTVKDTVLTVARLLYEGVRTWLLDRFTSIVDGMRQKIEAVTGFFRNMYEAVVGSSFVPDMVRGIGEWFDKLDGEMVQPSRESTTATASLFDDMQGNVTSAVSGITDSLGEAFSLENLRGLVTNPTETATRMLGDAWEAVKGRLQKLLTDMMGSFLEWAGGISGILSQLGSAIGSFLGGIGPALGGIGSALAPALGFAGLAVSPLIIGRLVNPGPLITPPSTPEDRIREAIDYAEGNLDLALGYMSDEDRRYFEDTLGGIVPQMAQGTEGRYLTRGMLAYLHPNEAITPRQDVPQLAADVASALSSIGSRHADLAPGYAGAWAGGGAMGMSTIILEDSGRPLAKATVPFIPGEVQRLGWGR